jgi:uncharacterized protein YbjQ (UPF0145 family)
MIVSTTSTLQAWEIEQYLGPVSVHLVAGTNLFSDWMAGWTDVFGGRSGTYGKQLSSLYQEASALLQREAARRGGNAIVGLSLDFDEISAQGKSMFMLNGVGTAVRVSRSLEQRRDDADPGAPLQADRMAVLRRRNRILRSLGDGTLEFNDSNWDFIIAHQVVECAPAVLALLRGSWLPEELTVIQDRVRNYVSNLPPADARDVLYRALSELGGEGSSRMVTMCMQLVAELNLLDYERVRSLLAHPDPAVRMRVVRLLVADRPEYGRGDIEELARLRRDVAEAFPPRWRQVQKKSLFSAAEKDAWSCSCGRTLAIDATVCGSCERDRHGFAHDGLKLADAFRFIDEKLAVLEEALA